MLLRIIFVIFWDLKDFWGVASGFQCHVCRCACFSISGLSLQRQSIVVCYDGFQRQLGNYTCECEVLAAVRRNCTALLFFIWHQSR